MQKESRIDGICESNQLASPLPATRTVIHAAYQVEFKQPTVVPNRQQVDAVGGIVPNALEQPEP
jgi:hypothetical protein